MTDKATIARVLNQTKTVAAVGFSDRDTSRANYYAPAYLKSVGYRVIPVHPRLTEGLSTTVYPSLAEIPEPVDLVLVYVSLAIAGEIVDQAIAIGAKAVWLPVDVVDEAAAERAAAAGLDVVMDHCPMVEHKYLDG